MVIGGAAVLLGAIYGIAKFSLFSGSVLDVIAICFISVGGVLTLISLIGLVTSCVRSYSLPYIFSFILLFTIIAQTLATILFVIFKPEADNVMKKALEQTLASYNSDGDLYEQGVAMFW